MIYSHSEEGIHITHESFSFELFFLKPLPKVPLRTRSFESTTLITEALPSKHWEEAQTTQLSKDLRLTKLFVSGHFLNNCIRVPNLSLKPGTEIGFQSPVCIQTDNPEIKLALNFPNRTALVPRLVGTNNS